MRVSIHTKHKFYYKRLEKAVKGLDEGRLIVAAWKDAERADRIDFHKNQIKRSLVDAGVYEDFDDAESFMKHPQRLLDYLRPNDLIDFGHQSQVYDLVGHIVYGNHL